MSPRLFLSLCFGAGVILQSIFMIQGKWNWKKLLYCTAAAGMGLLPGKHETHYQPYSHLLFFFLLFAILFAFSFKEEVMEKISEHSLFSYTLTFWYVFLIYFFRTDTLLIDSMKQSLLIFFLFPTLTTLYLVCTRKAPSFHWHVFYYCWFLTAIVFIGLFQYKFSILSVFFEKSRIRSFSGVRVFVSGMAFSYIVIHGSYLIGLLPVAGKNQKWEDRKREIEELMNLMGKRFEDTQLNFRQTLMILLSQGTLLGFDYYFRFWSHAATVDALILLPMIIAQIKKPILSPPVTE